PAPASSAVPASTSTAGPAGSITAQHVARNNSPDVTSPAIAPALAPSNGSRGSNQATNNVLASPAPFDLPESVMAVPASTVNGSNSADSNGANSKAPGLMRRLSRGAANKLGRRRQSISQHDKRD